MTSEDHSEFWGRVREQVPGLPSAPPPAWAFGATAEHAHAEGEGDRTLEDWRRGHEAFWGGSAPAASPRTCPWSASASA